MSKILKRPMFRKGGSTGEGIMSKVEPRQNYAQGQSVQSIYKQLQPLFRSAIDQRRDDTLSNFLIRGGLNLIQGTGEDRGLLREAAASFKGPTEQAIKERTATDALRTQADIGAIGAAVKIASAKKDRGFATQTFEEQVKNKQNFYRNAAYTGKQAIKYSRNAPKEVRAEMQLKTKFYGPVEKIEDAINIAKQSPEGTVFLDVDKSSYFMVKEGKVIPVTFEQAVAFNMKK